MNKLAEAREKERLAAREYLSAVGLNLSSTMQRQLFEDYRLATREVNALEIELGLGDECDPDPT